MTTSIEFSFLSTEEIFEKFSECERVRATDQAEQWYKTFSKRQANQHERRISFDDVDEVDEMDRSRIANACAKEVCENLDANACLIFSECAPGLLILDAAYSDILGEQSECVTAECKIVESDTDDGFDALHLDLLGGAGDRQFFTADAEYCLDIPITDRRSSVIGALRVVRWEGNAAGAFDHKDRQIANLTVDRFSRMLDSESSRRQLRKIVSAIRVGQDRPDILDVVLQKSVAVAGGDRGDLVVWDERLKDLQIRAQFGFTTPIAGGSRVPNPSIIRDVWANGNCLRIPFVQTDNRYFPADSETRSELTVRIDCRDKAVGVLNIESYRDNAFDEQDADMLRVVSQMIAAAVLEATESTGRVGILKHWIEEHPLDTDVLRLTLRGVEEYFGCDAGLIYYADYAQRLLRCVQSHGCDKLQNNSDEFSFSFDDNSLAGKVFHEKQPYFTANATSDPHVSTRGIDFFDIHGPLIGVPLLYEDRVVGVMVVWSRNGVPPTRDMMGRLEPFVKLASPSIAARADRRLQEAIIRVAEDILSVRQSSNSK